MSTNIECCNKPDTCWEPCGLLGNDEEFVRVTPNPISDLMQAALEELEKVSAKDDE